MLSLVGSGKVVGRPFSVRQAAQQYHLSFPLSLSAFIRATIPAPPPPPPITTPPTPGKPYISVRSNGDGSFLITGANFLADKNVYIRIQDTDLTTLTITQTANHNGMLEYPTGLICRLPGQLTFDAHDDRMLYTDPPATSRCPG